MHNSQTTEKEHVFSDKQIHMVVDTIVSFVIQSGQVSEGRACSLKVTKHQWAHLRLLTCMFNL